MRMAYKTTPLLRSAGGIDRISREEVGYDRPGFVDIPFAGE